ncbi:MAG: gliding motility-associated ABC transporter ATP-binding subunit GldA [Prevotellaceae bacterium]|jgi:ABC-2 type transport system ATP-binding protein|nr:gliding motility-associated ABC transporter ATP-binding subunit GldA [Prevotellaceae bacterium]
MSVSVEYLDKYYGSQRVLKSVSFNIKGAGVTGFLGPNGAGKSTMMKILSGVISPSTGVAKVNGMDVLQYPTEIKRIIGYLPEHNPLYLDMYVKEYLYMTASIYKVRQKKQAVSKAIEMTGLVPECKKKIGKLSKGYRQRVGLAQNLLHNPEVLILDEPTTGLDPNQIVDIRNLIKEMGKEKTVMLSSHIMQEVEAICDNIIIINNGEIVADETTSSLKISDKVVEIEFLETIGVDVFKDANFVEKVEAAESGAFLIKGFDNEDIRAELFRWAVENRLTIISMRQKEHRLEDVFRLITQQSE